jgi:hypothetical protein
MKVLLDACVDWRLSRDIVGRDVRTAQAMGWAAMSNGELLDSKPACGQPSPRRQAPGC